MRTSKILLTFTLAILSYLAMGQNSVGIGTTTPSNKAVLQLVSTGNDQGFMVPKLTSVQRAAIAPALSDEALLVYDMDLQSFMYWDGVSWNSIGGSDNDWVENNDTIYNNTHYVVVGGTSPLFDAAFTSYDKAASQFNIGLVGESENGSDFNVGVYGHAIGNGTDTTAGVIGEAENIDGVGVGVRGEANTGAVNSMAFGGSFEANDFAGNGDIRGVEGNAVGDGATTNTAVGIYGEARDAAINYAGYFGDGNVLIQNNLGIGVDPTTKLDIQAPFGAADNIVKIGENGTANRLKLSSGTTAYTFGGGSGAVVRHDVIVNHTTANVGIGTGLFPTEKLDVAGNINYANALRVNGNFGLAGQVLTSGGGGINTWVTIPGASNDWTILGNAGTASGTNFIGTTDNAGFTIRTNNIQRIRVSTAGDVGIGTASPTTKLDVEVAATTASNAGIDINNADATGVYDPRLRFQIAGVNTWSLGADNSDGDKFKLATGANIGSGAILTADGATGNVGIGTTAPETSLHIRNNNAGVKLKIGDDNQPSFDWNFEVDAVSNMTISNENGGSQEDYLYFDTNNDFVGIGSSNTSTHNLYIPYRIYDWDNTNYYLDPGSLNQLNSIHIWTTSDFGQHIYNSAGNYGGGVGVLDDIVSVGNGSFNLGAPTYQWNNLYIDNGIYLNGNSGVVGEILTSNGAGAATWNALPVASDDWTTSGNAISAGQILGTTNAQNLVIRAGGTTAMTIDDVTQHIGIGVTPGGKYRLHLETPSTFHGADTAGIYVRRLGANGATNGGTSWQVTGIDAAIKGYSYYGNNFTAGVAGYNYNDYTECAGVIGSDRAASYYGALGYKDASSATWGGYFHGEVFLDDALKPNGVAGTSGQVLTSSGGGVNTWTTPTTGDITGVTAGTGLTGGGTSGTPTLNVIATNGLTANANDIRLGGTLVQTTTINQGIYGMTYNLNSTGDFIIQDNGVTEFTVLDNGDINMDNNTLFVDASTNEVHIGSNANPAQKLDVEGSVQIDGEYYYEANKTHYQSFSWGSFQSILPQNYLFGQPNATTEYGYFVSGGSSFGYADGALNLPDGAVVTELRAWIYDNGTSNPVRVRLFRQTLGSSSSTMLANVETSSAFASTAIQQVSTALSSTVNNASYVYKLEFTGRQNSTLTRLYGVRITYTVIKAD